MKKPSPTYDTISKKNEVLTKAFLRMAVHYEFTRQDICNIIGFSEASASRLFSGTKFIEVNSKEGEMALLLLRVYRNLNAILDGSNPQAVEWLRSQHHYFNETPLQHMQTLAGLVETVNYLDAMRGKI